MGKGDRRSRKGKIWRHSYGVTRKRKKITKPAFVPKVKKEKKIIKPIEGKIIIPQTEPVTVQMEEKVNAIPEVTTKNEVAASMKDEAVAAEVNAVIKKTAKPKKTIAAKKAKPAEEKKAPAAKRKPATKEKKAEAPKKKTVKKK